MDSATKTFSVDQIADLVVERLMEKNGSLANLGTASLEVIEEQTLASVDQITRDVISKLLGKQAQLVEVPEICPTCGGKLCLKPSQGRSLQSRRGSVHFKTEVAHCEACRLDFFPSVQSARV
jgi:uncharacterized protein with PIN domain